MEQIGTVERVENGMAIVCVKRQSACSGSCRACGGCAEPTVKAEAFNPVNAMPGDTVVIDTPTGRVLAGAFLVYMVPVLTMIAGYCFFRLIGAVVGFFAPYIILYKLSGIYTKLTIVKVVEK